MHRWSQLFIPTLREAPADAEVASHKFLVRAGYIRQLAAGLYSFLFLGNRTLVRITKIVREEMDRIGQEFYLPALHPREIWEVSGRWQVMGDNMFRLKDRGGRDLCLGMTEEEVMTEIARKELRSYKQLPQIWYQIQQKFRDEPRPKSGLLRVRQFTMKDSYSFDIDAAGLDVSYRKHYDAYCRIFDRCGLRYVVVEAHSGAMGGSQSHEFMIYTDAGEDFVVSCPSCGYAANLEKATSKLEPVEDLAPTNGGQPELVHTPGQKTIEDVARFLGVPPKNTIKTLAYMAQYSRADEASSEVPVVVFLRGDHTLNESKLMSRLIANGLRLMHPEEVQIHFGSSGGFLGPIGLNVHRTMTLDDLRTGRRDLFEAAPNTEAVWVIVDEALRARTRLIGGANQENYHLRNLTPGQNDFAFSQIADVRNAVEGEGCPSCGKPLKVAKAVEIGHIFKLGYKYSESMGARVLDENGKEVMPIMGSYGIGLERILTSCIEQNNDENGFWLPVSIAPFQVVIVPTNTSDEKINSGAIDIANRLEAAGLDVLLDDRDERPGVKFKDADLVGIPYRVNVGKKLGEGIVEVVTRSAGSRDDVPVASVVEHLQRLVSQDGASRRQAAGQ
jgi:prolyl-tRNA synthetase